MFDIVYGETDQPEVASRLAEVLRGMSLEGSFYIGYPVIASADEQVVVDALLLTEQHGLVAFIFSSRTPPQNATEAWEQLQNAQDQLSFAIDANLARHDKLRSGRKRGVETETITLFPTAPDLPNDVEGKIRKTEKQLDSALAELLSGDVLLDALSQELREKLKRLSIRVEGAE